MRKIGLGKSFLEEIMNTIEAIEKRRSIKHYDANHVMPEEDLKELIRVTKLAPSSFNIQNYRLVVVRDKELRQKIKEASWNQAQVTDASVVFFLCADLNAHMEDPTLYWGHAPQQVQDMLGPMIKKFYEGNDELIRDEAMRSTALAGMALMLAAKELGYDSCPMVGFDFKAVAELINLPEDHVISFMVTIGKQTQDAWDRGPRLSDEKVVIYDKY
jgi:nitroreductase